MTRHQAPWWLGQVVCNGKREPIESHCMLFEQLCQHHRVHRSQSVFQLSQRPKMKSVQASGNCGEVDFTVYWFSLHSYWSMTGPKDPLHPQVSRFHGGAPPLLPFIPANKLKNRKIDQTRKENDRYKPTAAASRMWARLCICCRPLFIWAGTSWLQ